MHKAIVRPNEDRRWLEELKALPFVSSPQKGPRNFWAVQDTGAYDNDCKLGAYYAAEAVSYMRRFGWAPLLSGIGCSMIERGKQGGIEVGFLMAIADYAERR